ncbi:MAG: hypothetical protein PHC86_03975 [Eubacteriales bacterium]|nr:hypothetical protein [Eubacteriales bacterium]
MACKHSPQFNLGNLFARKPKFICRKCGVELEMSMMTHSVNRALNAVLVASLFFKVLSGTASGTLVGFALDMGILMLYILAYLVAYYLLIQFGKYQEKVLTPEEIAAMKEVADAKVAQAEAEAEAAKLAAAQAGTSALSQEQIDLLALYESYSDQERAEAAQNLQSSSPVTADPVISGNAQHKTEDVCNHKPVKSWKIYIPTYMNMTCEHCGKPITFTAATKKSMNIAVMAVVLLVLMPSFMNNEVDSLEYFLLTLGAFALAAVIQAVYLYKGQYEIRNLENKKRW